MVNRSVCAIAESVIAVGKFKDCKAWVLLGRIEYKNQNHGNLISGGQNYVKRENTTKSIPIRQGN